MDECKFPLDVRRRQKSREAVDRFGSAEQSRPGESVEAIAWNIPPERGADIMFQRRSRQRR